MLGVQGAEIGETPSANLEAHSGWKHLDEMEMLCGLQVPCEAGPGHPSAAE